MIQKSVTGEIKKLIVGLYVDKVFDLPVQRVYFSIPFESAIRAIFVNSWYNQTVELEHPKRNDKINNRNEWEFPPFSLVILSSKLVGYF